MRSDLNASRRMARVLNFWTGFPALGLKVYGIMFFFEGFSFIDFFANVSIIILWEYIRLERHKARFVLLASSESDEVAGSWQLFIDTWKRAPERCHIGQLSQPLLSLSLAQHNTHARTTQRNYPQKPTQVKRIHKQENKRERKRKCRLQNSSQEWRPADVFLGKSGWLEEQRLLPSVLRYRYRLRRHTTGSVTTTFTQIGLPLPTL